MWKKGDDRDNMKEVKKKSHSHAFLQRRHTDGQQAHEKMFNVANYQTNANQNYNEISPHTSQNGYHQKSTMNAGKGAKRREPFLHFGGTVNWYSHYGKQHGGSFKS